MDNRFREKAMVFSPAERENGHHIRQRTRGRLMANRSFSTRFVWFYLVENSTKPRIKTVFYRNRCGAWHCFLRRLAQRLPLDSRSVRCQIQANVGRHTQGTFFWFPYSTDICNRWRWAKGTFFAFVQHPLITFPK